MKCSNANHGEARREDRPDGRPVAVPVAQRAYRHREQRGVDSGKATKGSPEGCPRWRQRSHTGVDSSENRVFYRNDPFETGSASNVICSGAVHEGASAAGAASVDALGNDKKRIAQRFPGAFHTAFDNRRRCLHGKSVRSRGGGDVRRNGNIRISGRGRRGI